MRFSFAIAALLLTPLVAAAADESRDPATYNLVQAPPHDDAVAQKPGPRPAYDTPEEDIAVDDDLQTTDSPAIPPDDAGIDDESVTDTDFHQALDPYGRWVDYGDYGQVWHPNVEEGWRPYSRGHWLWTDAGWTWADDAAWGWAPFHYGRWLYDDVQGWLWRPGHHWGPAWVGWAASGNNYWGWSALGPAGWRYRGWTGHYGLPSLGWNFVSPRAFTNPHLGPYLLSGGRLPALVTGSRALVSPRAEPGRAYASGPARGAVEHLAGRPILGGTVSGRTITPTWRGSSTERGSSMAEGSRQPIQRTWSAPQASHYATPNESHYASPNHYSSPSYSSPRYSSPRYSPPRYSSPHYSSPGYSPHYSSPSHSFGGGGGHSFGGGGHFGGGGGHMGGGGHGRH